jgi:hypothetical protein
MGIEIYCDGRQCRSKNMDIFYCVDCYTFLESELEKANQKIMELEDELAKPKDEVKP